MTTVITDYRPPSYEPPPAYSEHDKANIVIISEPPGAPRRRRLCTDRLPLNAGCQVFGWVNILLHSTVLSICIYGYAMFAQHASKIPVQIKIVMALLWAMASIAILANVLLLIGVYKKNIKCIKTFVIIYGIYVCMVSFGLFKQSLLMQMDSKQFYETLLGISLAVISLLFGHGYYMKLKKESEGRVVSKTSTSETLQEGIMLNNL